ncbi:rod shape-determining protein MreC [Candidatus Vesicomyidisocius calyptogenae]|uniref:Cell shape-determining protein MreC n=1 Tax=Vesicomyosocius okutanii subsp. Calyptogena okutanii (strain HA) TaxID=412965 RepID=A5CW43_VESOH|nr:rod shape-determining protein MreC [Candidatus Vesicomyosocius okutanii]BAF61833.1 rod shape-determining protein MreC [Candidatus Vesicomyosocius okutanii]
MKFLELFIPVIISILLILSDYKFSYLNHLRQSIETLISPIYMVVNLPSQIYIWIDKQGTSKDQLTINNDNLHRELLKLKAKLQTYNALALENKKLQALLGSSYTVKQQNFTLARISELSQSRIKKQIIINKGSSSGIKIGQIALSSKGIIGQISRTTPLYSTILMASDPTQHVPVKNERSGVRGISKGIANNNHLLSVEFIEPNLDVKVGDVFLSSAIGSKFPDGYPVGTVISVEKNQNEPFLHIQLKPAQIPEQLEFVIITTD